jgi:hypothetical protein
MKRISNKNVKIIAATAMTIFSLFAAVTGAFAWFTSHINEASRGTDFGVYHDNSQITTISCYAIKYDGIQGAVAKQVASGQENAIQMSEYDYVLRDRNVNTPLFFRIELSDFNTSKDLEVTIPAAGAYKLAGQSTIESNLSNVVCAKFSYGLDINGTLTPDTYELSGSTISGGNVKTIYEGMRDRVKNMAGTPFVTSTTEKDDEITLTLPAASLYQSSNIVHRTIDGETVDIVVVYIVFDYYVTNSINLVERYINSYGNSDNYSRTFDPDIGAISLRDVEA